MKKYSFVLWIVFSHFGLLAQTTKEKNSFLMNQFLNTLENKLYIESIQKLEKSKTDNNGYYSTDLFFLIYKDLQTIKNDFTPQNGVDIFKLIPAKDSTHIFLNQYDSFQNKNLQLYKSLNSLFDENNSIAPEKRKIADSIVSEIKQNQVKVSSAIKDLYIYNEKKRLNNYKPSVKSVFTNEIKDILDLQLKVFSMYQKMQLLEISNDADIQSLLLEKCTEIEKIQKYYLQEYNNPKLPMENKMNLIRWIEHSKKFPEIIREYIADKNKKDTEIKSPNNYLTIYQYDMKDWYEELKKLV